jgi:hypothetical protein
MVYPVDRAPISLDDLVHLDLEQQSKTCLFVNGLSFEIQKSGQILWNYQKRNQMSILNAHRKRTNLVQILELTGGKSKRSKGLVKNLHRKKKSDLVNIARY